MTLQAPSAHDRNLPGLASLNLPPMFISEHCLRTLFYHGPLSPVELAAHWRVPQDVAVEVIESMKGAGLVEPDAGQTTFERHARVRMTTAGQAQVAQARQRTWYAGPMPVSAGAFADGVAAMAPAPPDAATLRAALGELSIDESQADELGQAASGSDVVLVTGAAPDEQAAVAQAVGSALPGETSLPFAIFAAGAVLRLFDPQRHHLAPSDAAHDDALDVMRQHRDAASPWIAVRRPVVTLAGGVRASDVTPAYDEDARFYLAPPPLSAFGGLLAVFDADADPVQLAELARLWLLPGKQGIGVVLVRSGERIEVPWRATTLVFATDVEALGAAGAAAPYRVDIAALGPAALRGVLSTRLRALAPGEGFIERLAEALADAGVETRVAAARAARYLLDLAAYEGAPHGLDTAVGRAVAYAEGAPQRPAAGARRPRRAA